MYARARARARASQAPRANWPAMWHTHLLPNQPLCSGASPAPDLRPYTGNTQRPTPDPLPTRSCNTPPPNFCPPPQSLHFPSRSSGFAGGRISVTCALAALAGWSCDKLLSKRRMSGSWERGYHLSLAKAHFLPPYLPTALPLPRISLSSSSSSSSSLSSSLSGVGWGLSKKLASPCPPLSGQLLPARGQRWSMRPSQTRRRSTRRGAPWQGWPNRAK